MSDLTDLQNATDGDGSQTSEELLATVYDELRKLAARRMAQESPDHTLQATALVHEAYLQLVASADGQHWDGRGHFFAALAEAMRRILVDRARQKQTKRRGGSFNRREIDPLQIVAPEPSLEVLAIHEALSRFEKIDKRKADLVKLRYFGGLTIPEAAAALEISPATANRAWAFARAWLHAELQRNKDLSHSRQKFKFS